MHHHCQLFVLCLLSILCFSATFADEVNDKRIQKAVAFYASFDEEVKADVGEGSHELSTRYDGEEKGTFVFEEGFRQDVFSIVKDKGVSGGSLQVTDVMSKRGRVFFPALGNLPYKADGWSGTVSFWISTDPNTMLKTKYCDPIQITQRRAGDGGLWIDFPDVKPHDLRLGAFRALGEGEKSVPEKDPNAPLIIVKDVSWMKQNDWHHLAMTWKNFDSGKKNASAKLYIDGKPMGELRKRDIAMKWELDKTGVYVAVSYIGLLDELAILNHALSDDEVKRLFARPDLFAR